MLCSAERGALTMCLPCLQDLAVVPLPSSDSGSSESELSSSSEEEDEEEEESLEEGCREKGELKSRVGSLELSLGDRRTGRKRRKTAGIVELEQH